MDLTEARTAARSAQARRQQEDRLTTALVFAAFVLVAAVAAIAADLWLRPSAGRSSSSPLAASIPATATRLPVAPTSEPPSSTPVPSLSAPAQVPEAEASAPEPAQTTTPPPCVPPDDWGIYVVQPGNTLYSLGRRFGTDVATLMRVNCLNTTTIFVDQRLYVPGPLPTVSVPTPVAESVSGSTAATGLEASDSTVGEGAAGVPTPLPAPTVQGALRIDMPERYLNIVLLGSDKRPRSGAWRTDSMIVVSVDSENGIVRLLSIPRDLWVFIPGHGYNRINTADLWGELARKGGGPERVKQTIQYNLGIPIHYYVRVDFQGFMKIIDTVGGVNIDVECPLPDIQLTAGMHHMNGAQALRYSRSRKSTNDFDRGRRQRKVLMALWDQALNLDIIPRLPTLWRQMSDSYQTDLPLEQVINLAYVGVRLKPQRILSRAIGPGQVQAWTTPEGASVLLPQADKIRALLNSYYSPLDPGSLDTGEQVRVHVVNAWQRKDAEQLAAAALRWGGYKVAGTSVAEARNQAQSQVLVYTGQVAIAQDVAQALGLPAEAVLDLTGSEQPADNVGPADIVVNLGRDYDPCSR